MERELNILNNNCSDKYIITLIDTENVPPSCFTQLAELVEYTCRDYNNAGYFCFGIDDGKSANSLGWREQTVNLKGLKWISVKGKREKNLVDQAIIKKIKSFIVDPRFSIIDVWVIVTSDGDYEPAIQSILAKGHKVIVASNNVISNKLMKSGCKIVQII